MGNTSAAPVGFQQVSFYLLRLWGRTRTLFHVRCNLVLRINPLLVMLSLALASQGCDLLAVEDLEARRREAPIWNRGPTLLLYGSMDSTQDIFRPGYSTATYSTIEEAIPGPAYITYEIGKHGNATRINANGYNGPFDGPVRFHGDNFDFDDTDDNGGRVDFWIKFNVDPDSINSNTWLARSNYGLQRYINFEFTSPPANFMIDLYGEIVHNERTNYENFRIQFLRSWNVFDNIKQGEWHLFTVTWRRNGGPHKAELHLYIDGTQEGCGTCNDYNGNLPSEGSVTAFILSPPLYGKSIPFSIDDVYSFSSWNVSGTTGSFADLQIPEGVTLTYPMATGYPVWGSDVQESNVVFEFFAMNYARDQFDCDLYVDNALTGSTTTTTQAHTEIASSNALAEGLHSFQVKCDNDRLVSAVTQFRVSLP